VHGVSLFWRIMLLNASVLVAATALLLFAPVTVSVRCCPPRRADLGQSGGHAIANGVLLRVGLARWTDHPADVRLICCARALAGVRRREGAP
jgi:hypothetical protein